MKDYILGVDLGTSSCKTVVFSVEGRKISESKKTYQIYSPFPSWAEQEPSEWYKAVTTSLKDSLRKAKITGKEIVGLGIDSQREAVVPVGKNGSALYRSIIWLDRRTYSQIEKIKKVLTKERVLSITGLKIDQIFSAAKILWLKENYPKTFEKTICFLSPKDYITNKLTGEHVTDFSMASRTMLFNLKKKKWSDQICSELDIPIDKLPVLKPSTKIIGEISKKASADTTLPKGLQIVNGGGDRPCECLGSGTIESNTLNIGTGSGSVFEVPLKNPKIDIQGRVNCCCHVIPII